MTHSLRRKTFLRCIRFAARLWIGLFVISTITMLAGCQPPAATTGTAGSQTKSGTATGISTGEPSKKPQFATVQDQNAPRHVSGDAPDSDAPKDLAAHEHASVATESGSTSGDHDAEHAISESGSTDDKQVDATPVKLQSRPPMLPVEMELGDPKLTMGIPGEGDLSIDEIKKWLANADHHRPIDPKLPLGLAAAAANITGLDENPMTLAKIELGRQLYFDTRLSSDNTISCASCHHPDTGYGAHTQFGVGVDGQTGNRNSPISYNRIVSGPQFWDGRAGSLEDQAVGPVANAIEMGNTHEACVESLKNIEGYRLQFSSIFSDGISIDNVGKALATFERALVTAPAPYDFLDITKNVEKQWGEDLDELEEEDPQLFARYQTAMEAADKMSESAKRGAALFFTEKSNCTACHAGANFADEKYHNLGVGMDAEEPDLGRFVVTNQEIDKGAFKTPTMRNVALSAPYMHDGSQQTLEEVVEWYAKGGHPNPFLSEKIKKLELSDQDKADLVAFMKEGLTSEFPQVATGRLPK